MRSDNLYLFCRVLCDGFHCVVQDAGDGDIDSFLLAENMAGVTMLDIPLEDARFTFRCRDRDSVVCHPTWKSKAHSCAHTCTLCGQLARRLYVAIWRWRSGCRS